MSVFIHGPATHDTHLMGEECGVMRRHKERRTALLKTGLLQEAILNSANFSSIATDEQGVIQIFNVGAEKMLGYTAADVVGKITPYDISDQMEVVARANALSSELGTLIAPGFEALVFKASRGIEDIYELTYICKDGRPLPAVVSVTALRNVGGAIIGYLLIGTSNIARKKAEAERHHLIEIKEEMNKRLLQSNVSLRMSEERLAATLNSIGDAVITTDEVACVTLMNPLAERLTGWTQAEASGREVNEVFNIINQETRQRVTIPVAETLVDGAVQGMANHTILISRNGTEFTIADSCAPIRDRDGVVIGAVVVFRDVSGEYAVQQALRDQQFYTRSLIESNIDAIMTTNPSGIITDVNKQMEALTGCTRDELIGAPFKNFFTDPDRAEANIKRVLSKKKIIDYELIARARDGRETVVSYNSTTFYDRDGKLQGVFAAARDITERKALDQVLQKQNIELETAKFVAEKANLAKSDFLSSMSHELRSPLNAILGFAQLMETGTPLPTDAQVVRLRQIIKAGWYLLELINEILDLAVIESGKQTVLQESVSLLDVVRECQAIMESQAQKSGIEIFFIPFDTTWMVKADRTRVRQVLINMLSNAIKYNRQHGTVRVECTRNNPERLRISVRDTGEGLSPEQVAQLFQPFNRLGQEGGQEEGTGIGLVVTKRLIELMGGTIGVESVVGEGSVFWVELNFDETPWLDEKIVKNPQLEFQHESNKEQHTLIYVEDNPANLTLVEQIISDYPNLNLLSACDGNQGLALIRAQLPDVILMDINLPGINGIEVMNILRKDPATMHIPVMALSANAMHRDIEKGLEAGFFRYLTKPIKINELMIALDDALKFANSRLAGANTIGETR